MGTAWGACMHSDLLSDVAVYICEWQPAVSSIQHLSCMVRSLHQQKNIAIHIR